VVSFMPLYPWERDPNTHWIGGEWTPEPAVWTRWMMMMIKA